MKGAERETGGKRGRKNRREEEKFRSTVQVKKEMRKG